MFWAASKHDAISVTARTQRDPVFVWFVEPNGQAIATIEWLVSTQQCVDIMDVLNRRIRTQSTVVWEGSGAIRGLVDTHGSGFWSLSFSYSAPAVLVFDPSIVHAFGLATISDRAINRVSIDTF